MTELLLQGDPCLVGRIGHTEGRIVGECLFRHGNFGRMTKKEAHQYSGIFPVTYELLSQFGAVYEASIAEVDLLGFWQTTFQARLLTERYADIPLAPLPALEPYLHDSPWSAALEGRRVLVVHPFADSIARQYATERPRLFADPRVLPQFELEVLTPPQTLAPMTEGYATWLEALDTLARNQGRHHRLHRHGAAQEELWLDGAQDMYCPGGRDACRAVRPHYRAPGVVAHRSTTTCGTRVTCEKARAAVGVPWLRERRRVRRIVGA
jgi:hypothetical protein